MPYTVALDTDNNLIDLEDAKTAIGIDLGDRTQDNKLHQLINGASWAANSITKRKLKSRTLTEHYSGDGTNELFTNQYPITTLTSVHDDLARAYGSDTLVDSDDLAIMPNDLAYKIVYDGGAFSKGIKNLKVVYIAGYITIPWDLAQAVIEIVMFGWNQRDKGYLGVISQQLADGSIQLAAADMPKSAKDILNIYKKKW